MSEKKEFKFDASKMLKGILETDSTVHENIKRQVEKKIIDNIVSDIEEEFIRANWDGRKEVRDYILDELKDKVNEIAKEILKDFYNSYKYNKKDITILKKLKELLEEE